MSWKGPRVGVLSCGAGTWVLSSLPPSLSLLGLGLSLLGDEADSGSRRPSWSLWPVTPVKKAVPFSRRYQQESQG